MNTRRSFWVTGASHGLGLAMVEQLLDQGHRVAASGRDSQQLDALGERHGASLLRLPGLLTEASQAVAMRQRLLDKWGALDGLIINAGACDYLPDNTTLGNLFEMIVQSNMSASERALNCALPALMQGARPQVMVIFNRYSALQLYDPTQPPSGVNSLPKGVREQRQLLLDRGIDLTVVAPPPMSEPLMPDAWTAQSAAAVLIAELEQRHPELMLEALGMNNLWPLPEHVR
ncbi:MULTISPECIES: SDR family oxidoreductase [unclassified Pseudomonas]|uniref:SDR family NAD(P)-dependent oxidoreductase n=1 Tax=unclassified Pseudomonas TaxID=196821 RepID=UPI002098292F|nr:MULTISPECIES: SDR family oxidoreductase [unclassified Pseudomonas]MCO7521152.1 SDR family oxidoreductase [Pseudomonas sp. 1]MCO7538524.1 SDR family oxidoreductase [Pseudomonas sp. VA159-2]